MACLDRHSRPLAAAVLGPRERAVIALARRDRLRSLAPPSRAGRWAAHLLGLQPPRPLACPRLEALRRAAVLRRHGRPAGVEERCRLTAAELAEVEVRTRPIPHRTRPQLVSAAHRMAELGAAWLDGGLPALAALVAAPLLRHLAA